MFTPTFALAMLLVAGPTEEDSETRTVVPVTRTQIKEILEASKKSTPRLPLKPLTEEEKKQFGERGLVNNGLMRFRYLPNDLRDGGFSREPDPKQTVDPTFKVMLFWVVSRANNCIYCLGHQEHKLTAAGVQEDRIAQLDGDWKEFTPAEQQALAFTLKLATKPHEITEQDVEAMGKYYTPLQTLEILTTVAGYTSTNRWTGGLNIPAEMDGNFFRKRDAKVEHDFSSFLTPTSEAYKSKVSLIAPKDTNKDKPAPAMVWRRPALESQAEVEKIWAKAKNRSPLLPLEEEAHVRSLVPNLSKEHPVPNWIRLLGSFKSSKGRINGLLLSREKGTLPAKIKAELAWTAARQDRAWYALRLAYQDLKQLGFSDEQIFQLDTDNTTRSEPEQEAIRFARKLTVNPARISDQDVERLRKLFTDVQVAEIVHHLCNAAFLNRVTETARLPLDRE